jgi:hypothetical protein
VKGFVEDKHQQQDRADDNKPDYEKSRSLVGLRRGFRQMAGLATAWPAVAASLTARPAADKLDGS